MKLEFVNNFFIEAIIGSSTSRLAEILCGVVDTNKKGDTWGEEVVFRGIRLLQQYKDK